MRREHKATEITQDTQTEEMHALETKLRLTQQEIELYQVLLAQREATVAALQSSTSWRVTKPLRWLSAGSKQILRTCALIRYAPKLLQHIRQRGFKGAWQTALMRLRTNADHPFNAEAAYKTTFWLDDEEAVRQSTYHFDDTLSFSILVPLYNTNPEHLEQMINSVRGQTFSNWQLCLADASDVQHSETSALAQARAKQDTRILYRKLTTNGGISANTNAALEMAGGSYLTLLDHDDLLHPSALYELAVAIEQTGADMLYTDEIRFSLRPEDSFGPHFKPDFSPDLLRSYNYITHLLAYSRELQERVGKFRPECDGSQDYDMALRVSEQATRIVHLAKLLYYWRKHESSYSANPRQNLACVASAQRALADQLGRQNIKATVSSATLLNLYRIHYEIDGSPLVSIIIPLSGQGQSGGQGQSLAVCLNALREKTSWQNFEVLLVGAKDVVFDELALSQAIDSFQKSSPQTPLKVLRHEAPDVPALCNFAAGQARGDYLVFLDSTLEATGPTWLAEMLGLAQRSDTGAVGARLLSAKGRVHHAGMVVGIKGAVGYAHRGFPRDQLGYMYRLQVVQNVSAVSAACLMVARSKFWEVEGFDESFATTLYDVDLCLRLRAQGYVNIYTPYAELVLHEAEGREARSAIKRRAERQERQAAWHTQRQSTHEGSLASEERVGKRVLLTEEQQGLRLRWPCYFEAGDPCYNPNLTLAQEDFSFKA